MHRPQPRHAPWHDDALHGEIADLPELPDFPELAELLETNIITTPAMVDITITLLSGDKLGRRISEHDATDAGPFALFDRAVAVSTAVERDCEQEVASIDIQLSRIRGSETQHQQRWSNVCGKVQHTADPLRAEMAPCIFNCTETSFGQKQQIFTLHGNFMFSSGGSTSLFRGFNSSSNVEHLMQHVFQPHTCRSVLLHMLVCSINIRHMVFVNSALLDRVLMAEHTQAHPRWHAVLINSIDNVHGVKSLHLENFDVTWLRSMCAECVRTVRMQISSHGSVNLFITPQPDTLLTTNFEDNLNAFCAFSAELCAKYT
jgi:hypothetical protein